VRSDLPILFRRSPRGERPVQPRGSSEANELAAPHKIPGGGSRVFYSTIKVDIAKHWELKRESFVHD
jgi:hypothetical protein